MILDFSTGNILDILNGRHWSSYTQILSKEELNYVKYVSIDLFRIKLMKKFNTDTMEYYLLKKLNFLLIGTNSKGKTILKNENGYRNFSRMRNRSMYSINKYSLPSTQELKQVIKQPAKKRGKYNK
jgi:transposase